MDGAPPFNQENGQIYLTFEMTNEWWKKVGLMQSTVSSDDLIDCSLMKELAGLKGKIPVLKELLVGKNVSRHGRGFQYGQISVFEKEEDLKVYDRHPEHRKLVKKIGPKLAGGISMDFEPL